MPALTKTQLEHAKQRVRECRAKFIAARTMPLGDEPEPTSYTPDEKVAMIRSGSATLKKNVWARTDLQDAFDYPFDAVKQLAYDAWHAKVNVIITEADAIEAGLIDELVMSPDGVSALQRIAAAFSA